MGRSIPDDWLDYKPYGTVITGTKIVPFKVPLRETVTANLHPDQQLTTSILMQAYPNMKYVIDLTNTNKYYNSEDFTRAGVKYLKIMIRGLHMPPLDRVKAFFKAVEDFTAESGDDEVIGVHCTHGVNRSDHLICRYLIQQLGQSCSEAMKNFADARGHPIARAAYIEDLKRQPVGQRIDVN